MARSLILQPIISWLWSKSATSLSLIAGWLVSLMTVSHQLTTSVQSGHQTIDHASDVAALAYSFDLQVGSGQAQEDQLDAVTVALPLADEGEVAATGERGLDEKILALRHRIGVRHSPSELRLSISPLRPIRRTHRQHDALRIHQHHPTITPEG